MSLIKNNLGQFTGKAVVEYTSEKYASNAVKLFNDRAVDDMVNKVKPVLEPGEESSRNEASLLARRVYLMNVPYDAHYTEIEALVKEFAPVDEVVVPRDLNGFAKGYAFVYLKKASDVQTVIDYVDGRHIRSRQIRAKTSLGGEALQQVLRGEKQR